MESWKDLWPQGLTRMEAFKLVCDAARNKDLELLNKAMHTTLFSIDIRTQIFITPAGSLAQQGNFQSAMWLFEQGANPHSIAIGAAMGRHKDFAEYFRRKHGANINFIALGAACAGDFEYVEHLRKRFSVHLGMIAEGAIMGGHQAYAEEILNEHPDLLLEDYIPWRNFSQNLNAYVVHSIALFIARGAIRVGNTQYADELRKKHSLDIKELMFGAAFINENEYADRLKSEYTADDIQAQLDKSYAIGKILADNTDVSISTYLPTIDKTDLMSLLAFLGFYCPQVTDKEESDVQLVEGLVEGLILGGHMKMFLTIKDRSEKENNLFIGFAISCGMRLYGQAINCFQSIEYAAYIHSQISFGFVENRKKRLFINCMIGFDQHSISQSCLLHQLSFVNNHTFLEELREYVAKNANMSHLDIKQRYDIISSAIKINTLMNKYKLDYDQALTFLENRALRTFITGILITIPHLPSFAWKLITISLFSYPFDVIDGLVDHVNHTFNKNFLKNDLEKYTDQFWIAHRNRSNSFARAVDATTSRRDLQSLVLHQHRLFNANQQERNKSVPKHEQALVNQNKDGFYETIVKYSNRL